MTTRPIVILFVDAYLVIIVLPVTARLVVISRVDGSLIVALLCAAHLFIIVHFASPIVVVYLVALISTVQLTGVVAVTLGVLTLAVYILVNMQRPDECNQQLTDEQNDWNVETPQWIEMPSCLISQMGLERLCS